MDEPEAASPDPDDPQTIRRAFIAQRLKAGRWIAGRLAPNPRKPGELQIVALSPKELAEREPLVSNKITANLLGMIERMERFTPQIQLNAIAEALGQDASWFDAFNGHTTVSTDKQAAADRLAAAQRQGPPPTPEHPAAAPGTKTRQPRRRHPEA